MISWPVRLLSHRFRANLTRVDLHTAASLQIELYSPQYFAACALGGVIACGTTHSLLTPVDLVKCVSQTNATAFHGTVSGMRTIYAGEAAAMGFQGGLGGLFRGFGPTLVGYSFQGLGKFGGNEFFKYHYSQQFSKEDQKKYRDLIQVGASATAEFFADLALCPFEAVKIRVQTSPQYANGLCDGLKKIIATEGVGSLYAGLVPLWLRQIPYTVVKFESFERIADLIYARLPTPKEQMSQVGQMGVVVAAGYAAGVLCAVISHPADVMVSKINQVHSDGGILTKAKKIYSGSPASGAQKAIKGIGWSGLWAGVLPRVFMIGTLTCSQFFAYGAVVSALGLPTPGGH
jgi:solute carrier family 25 phosphate transporter 3